MAVAAYVPPAPLTGSLRVLGTVALSLATFMNVLDTSIANVSVPAISGNLGVSPTQGTWVITSFGVANAISVPLTGWLTQRFGQVRLFVTSVLLFVLSSWLCGLAPNLEALIAFRVLQGAVAGPMIPLSQTLLLSSYPKEKSGVALALWSMTTLIAPVCGPLLGGWISDDYSWPWIFYINVPVGLLAAYVTWAVYRKRETPTRQLPVDVTGLALLMLWVGSLQILLDKGREVDWFNSSLIVTLAVVAAVAFVFFLIWECFNNEHPIVDLTLFKSRNFATGVFALALAYATFFGNLVVLPLWLQTNMGYSATQAGMTMAPVGLLAIIMSPIIGANLVRWDARKIATLAFVTFATVCFMRAHFSTEADFTTIMIPTIIQGAAMAMFFVPLLSISFAGLPPERIPNASGLSNFARIMMGSFGASAAASLWENRSSLHHAQLTEHVTHYRDVSNQAFDNMNTLGMSPDASMALMERGLSQQANMLGANDVFWLSGFLFIGLTALIWIAKPPHRDAPIDAGGAH